MDNKKSQYLIEVMKKEIIPALGCTEPVSVALAVAKAKSLLEPMKEPESIEIFVSRNVLKNGMSVGIPGTNYFGLEYAAALGAFGGNSDAGLEVFKDIGAEDIALADQFINEKGVKVNLKEVNESLYIEALVKANGSEARAIISGTHTNIILLIKNREIIYKKATEITEHTPDSDSILGDIVLKDIYEFSTNTPLENLMFLKEVIRLNSEISEEGLKNNYGLQLGKKMNEKINLGILGKDLCNLSVMRCVSAIDARMAGCTLPAMSNSGSGNQGITATLPVCSVAKELKVPEENLIRAVALSHLVSIYIKKHLDRLSALCGAIIAATGASCGITYLIGGEYKHIEISVKNMVANISGMICDGAKSSCALKVSSSVQAAFCSVYLAMDEMCVKDIEGIIEKDVDRTIENLGLLGTMGMKETDKIILDIMISK